MKRRISQVLVCGSFLMLAEPPAALFAQATRAHPDRLNLSRIADAPVLRKADTLSGDGALNALARQLRSASQVAVAGTLDDGDDIVFGTIASVAVRDGHVAVLDRSMQRVLVLGPDLKQRSELGREGSGPSEFRAPIAVGFNGDSLLRVYDAALGLKQFAMPRLDTVGGLVKTTPPTVAVMAACLGGEDVIAVAPSSLQPGRSVAGSTEPLVSVLGDDGRVKRTFGDSYESPSPLVRRIMSEASMSCDASGYTAVALTKLPALRVYGPDGQLSRVWRLRDFEIGASLESQTESGQPSIGLDPSTRSMSTVANIVPLGQGRFIAQVAKNELSRDRRSFPEVAVDTYLVDARSGEGLFVSSRLPKIAAVEGNRFVGFRNDPFPQVTLWRLP